MNASALPFPGSQTDDDAAAGGPPAGSSALVLPGLPGFPELRHFRLWTDPAYSPPFEMLVSEQDPAIGFYLLDPLLGDPAYSPPVSDADRRELMLEPGDRLTLRVVVTIAPSPDDTTVNLAAPIILNLAAGVGRQVILEGSSYPLRAPLLPLLQGTWRPNDAASAQE